LEFALETQRATISPMKPFLAAQRSHDKGVNNSDFIGDALVPSERLMIASLTHSNAIASDAVRRMGTKSRVARLC